MAKRIKQKARNKVTRKRKKIVLIGSEGKNKTEKNYFDELFKTKDSEYICKFSKGNFTDPKGIVESTIRTMSQLDLDFENQDLVFCVFDTDVNPNKQKEIDEAIKSAKSNSIEVILSNPCFEVWYLQHFRYSTKSFQNNDEVLKELSKHIPEYKKSGTYNELIQDKEKEAIKNSIRLEEYHKSNFWKHNLIYKNPSTEVYKIFELFK